MPCGATPRTSPPARRGRLRIAIRTKGVLALTMLDEWLLWAARCRIPAFVELARKIKLWWSQRTRSCACCTA